MSEVLVTHDRTGARFEAPADWVIVVPDESGAAAVAVAAVEAPSSGAETTPTDPSFRANLVLTTVPNAGVGLEEWQRASDALLAEGLPSYLLLDFEETTVAGREGVRRLAHYDGPEGDALVLEQWATTVGDVGITLTATVDTLRYDALADELERCAATLTLPETIS